ANDDHTPRSGAGRDAHPHVAIESGNVDDRAQAGLVHGDRQSDMEIRAPPDQKRMRTNLDHDVQITCGPAPRPRVPAAGYGDSGTRLQSRWNRHGHHIGPRPDSGCPARTTGFPDRTSVPRADVARLREDHTAATPPPRAFALTGPADTHRP